MFPCRFRLPLSVLLVSVFLEAEGFSLDLVELIKQVGPAVVRIDTVTSAGEGIGSGVVIDLDGLVITNRHVIQGAKSAKVTFRSGKEFKVQGYLAIEPKYDLALIKTDRLTGYASALPLAKAPPQEGEKVAAFGSPQGFSFTTSEGIVSSLRTGRQLIDALGDEQFAFLGYAEDSNWVQTTAAISGGNSGGPLVNMQGELLGLNTWSRIESQNLNFAISTVDIARIFEAHRGDQLRPLEKMPGFKRDRKKSPEKAAPPEFTLKLPTGRVFSFRAFEIGETVAEASQDKDSETIKIKRSNGLTYGFARHQRGILHGLAAAKYENDSAMIIVNFQNGKRHGILESFYDDEKPALYSQYTRGNRDGFTCFWDGDQLSLIIDYKLNQPKWIQRMSGEKELEGFDSLAKAQKHPKTAALMMKMDAFDDKLRKEEMEFRKQARKVEEEDRQAVASQLGPEKRRRIQQRHNEHSAANSAFLQEMARRARGGN